MTRFPDRTTGRTRVTIGAVGLGALLLLAAACSSSGSDAAVPETTAPTTTAVAIPAGSTAVAMGSSFAAGSGIPDQLPGTTCGRSDANYSSLVAEQLDLTLVDVSCGGASAAQLLTESQGAYPPQIQALTPDTRLVTITVGGNDLGYVPTANACALGDVPCTVDQAVLDQNAAELVTDLGRLFDQIRATAPDARIVFVTYPRMVYDQECEALGFDPAEAAVMTQVQTTLQQAFIDATDGRDDVLVIDPYSATGDHGPCAAPDQSWITGKAPPTGTNFHPTPAEHVAVADLIVAALQG